MRKEEGTKKRPPSGANPPSCSVARSSRGVQCPDHWTPAWARGSRKEIRAKAVPSLPLSSISGARIARCYRES